ncbi:MAG TPA: LCP family protein [Actinomycetota bacterium]|nr:LCP family protein [Actinomycetota bacterium]
MADDAAVQPTRPGHPRVRRTFLALSAGVSALAMVVSAIAMGAYFWTRSQIETFEIEPPPVAAGSTEPPPADVAGRCAERDCNYLLLGSDSREGLTPEEQVAFGTDEDIGGENRADTIILVHTEPDQKEAVFLSFPRDLWVDIPGVGMGKINSAFQGGIQGGGPLKVARTVKQLTGMQIHHVLYVDLAGFQGLVDALGGVDMCVPYPMQDELTGLDIPAGCQRFDGATALAYVRTRHQPCDTVPDFARISRQQQFLRAVISGLLRPGELLRLPTLVPELLDNLVVDEGLRNPAELVYLAGQLNGVSTSAAQFRSVPTIPAGTYVNGQYLSIVKTIQPDADELFRRVREGRPLGDLGTELSQTAPSPANIVVGVYEREAPAVAAEVYGVLTEGGFDTSPGIVGSVEIDRPVKGAVILYREGAEPQAKVVGSYLRNLELVAAPPETLPEGQDVAVIVTARYAIPPPETAPPVECP